MHIEETRTGTIWAEEFEFLMTRARQERSYHSAAVNAAPTVITLSVPKPAPKRPVKGFYRRVFGGAGARHYEK